VALTLIITVGMAFSLTGLSASAAQIGSSSDFYNIKTQSVSSGKQVKDSGNQQSNSDKLKMSNYRDMIRMTSIAVYPAEKVYYYAINDTQDYPVSNSSTTYTFTQAVKDDLIAKYKAAAKVDPTGWEVKITFLIYTAKGYSSHLYLKLNDQQLSDYPITVDNALNGR
jgi:hypothetical protein